MKAARHAVDLVAPEAAAEVNELQDNPVKFLSKRVIVHTVSIKHSRERQNALRDLEGQVGRRNVRRTHR